MSIANQTPLLENAVFSHTDNLSCFSTDVHILIGEGNPRVQAPLNIILRVIFLQVCTAGLNFLENIDMHGGELPKSTIQIIGSIPCLRRQDTSGTHSSSKSAPNSQITINGGRSARRQKQTMRRRRLHTRRRPLIRSHVSVRRHRFTQRLDVRVHFFFRTFFCFHTTTPPVLHVRSLYSSRQCTIHAGRHWAHGGSQRARQPSFTHSPLQSQVSSDITVEIKSNENSGRKNVETLVFILVVSMNFLDHSISSIILSPFSLTLPSQDSVTKRFMHYMFWSTFRCATDCVLAVPNQKETNWSVQLLKGCASALITRQLPRRPNAATPYKILKYSLKLMSMLPRGVRWIHRNNIITEHLVIFTSSYKCSLFRLTH